MSKRNNDEAKTLSDVVGVGKCTCGCNKNENSNASNYADKLDAALGSIASFINPYPRSDNTADSNIPYFGIDNGVATEYAYGNHPAGQHAYPNLQMYANNNDIQKLYKTADGADTRIAEAVKKFVIDYDEFTLSIIKHNDDVDDEIVSAFNKSANMAKSCLMNSIMRFVTQPCTDDEVMHLITDFCDRHRSNSSYIYENDGDATKEDAINAIKNYDDAITQLLIYKLSGLTR